MVILCLTFGGTCTKLFSTTAAPSYVPTSNARGFQFLHILIARDILKCNVDPGITHVTKIEASHRAQDGGVGCCPEWPGRDPWAGAWGTALQHCSWGWGAGRVPAAPWMAAPTPRARRTRSKSQEQGREGSSGYRTQRPESSHWLL